MPAPTRILGLILILILILIFLPIPRPLTLRILNHTRWGKRSPVFNKIFRWQSEKPGGPLPVRVEIAGSFNGWQKTPLKYDRINRVWQLTLENIPGNCTHNYMLLVNGRPTADKNSDGLAVPHTEQEKQHQLETPRGPRVFMLFSQTK